MSAQDCTKWYIIIVTLLSFAWTFFMQSRYGTNCTISWVMQEWARDYPLGVGLVFAVISHWYWPVR